ncbi:MAG: hypothetical protein LBL67_05800 [Coriobacteriales bacterium]|jgi:molybdopterin molybdotransferase|nr:hypothetical protein [Coriobacteriales bacterium]
MRDHSKHIVLTRDEAVTTMLKVVEFSPSSRLVPLDHRAAGLTLAEDAKAQVNTPNVLTCAMDSIAVHWSDFAGLAAGELPDTSQWVRGEQWQFANTGVAMPEGFDTAIVIEHVQVSADEQKVTIDAAPSKQFAGTRAVASELAMGDTLASAGTRLTPDLLAHLAQGGLRQLEVVAAPRVAFIPTGGELIPVAATPQLGKNTETNSVLIAAKIAQWGGEPVIFPIIPDDPEQIEAAVKTACADCDIVVLNAGSSKGSEDWSCEELDKIGRVLCHETTHGPGHHSSYAIVDGTPVVGISGPPGGASPTTSFYVKPLIQKWFGRDSAPHRLKVKLAAEFKGHKPAPAQPGVPARGEDRPFAAQAGDDKPFYRISFLKLSQDVEGTVWAEPISGHPGVSKAVSADAIYMKPNGPEAPVLEVGDVLEAELLD